MCNNVCLIADCLSLCTQHSLLHLQVSLTHMLATALCAHAHRPVSCFLQPVSMRAWDAGQGTSCLCSVRPNICNWQSLLPVQALAAEQGRAFVAPYDDPYTIAGQGTIGTEILRQLTTAQLAGLHAIFVPVGGGGLIAGIAAYVKALMPDVKIIGVECTGAFPNCFEPLGDLLLMIETFISDLLCGICRVVHA